MGQNPKAKRKFPPRWSQKEVYRLWFEYLRVARQSQDTKVKAALVVSEPFYAPWQMEKGESFDEWWKTHASLFEEKYVVRELKPGEPPLDPEALILEVRLTQSPTDLTKKAKAIIQAAVAAREEKKGKSKRKPSAYYKLTEGAEPKLVALRQMLSVYRDVRLKNPELRGEKLLNAVKSYYLGRKRQAKVPTPLLSDNGDEARAMRNLHRYIQKAKNIVLNVARGQFPGSY